MGECQDSDVETITSVLIRGGVDSSSGDTMGKAPVRVLLIEDDEDDYVLVRDMLSQIPGVRYDLEWQPAGGAGLERLLQHQHDVCLLDYNLGLDNGLDLLREAHGRSCTVPIIFLTGREERQLDLAAMREGAADFLTKGDIRATLLERALRYAVERHRAEAAMMALGRQHERILKSSIIGIVVGARDCITDANDTFLDMLGYTRQDLPLRWEDITPPEYHEMHRQAFDEVLIHGAAPPFQKECLRRDGTRVWVLTGILLLDEIQANAVAFILDLTTHKTLEAEVRQSQKMEAVGRLAAGVAHEINTPIQYVGLNLRFLQDAFGSLQGLVNAMQALLDRGDLNPEITAEVAQALDTADVGFLSQEVPLALQQGLEGVDRVARIVRAMKEFAHPGAAERLPTDLNRAIQTTLDVSRNEWKYVAEVVTDFDPALPPVPCISGEINQVFLNLVINAAHAIAEVTREGQSEKGTITITTRQLPGCVEIRFTDTGCGIPESVRTKIYDPFFTTKEVGKGTGQGLAIARNVVVDKHGGSIGCESSVGIGTTFVICLPLEEKKSEPG